MRQTEGCVCVVDNKHKNSRYYGGFKTFASFKKQKTEEVSTTAFSPRSKLGGNGMCPLWNFLNCFSLKTSNFPHKIIMWFTVSSWSHSSQVGLCCFLNRKLCIRCVCRMRRRYKMTSLGRSSCLLDPHYSTVSLAVWSLLLLSLSHDHCHFAVSSLRINFIRSLCGTLTCFSVPFLACAAHASALSFPLISTWLGT